jgi:hypothetical protein
MVERIASAIITVSSLLLFGYWLRCAVLLLRGQYPPPEAAFSAPAGEKVVAVPTPRVPSSAGIS